MVKIINEKLSANKSDSFLKRYCSTDKQVKLPVIIIISASNAVDILSLEENFLAKSIHARHHFYLKPF